MWGTEIQKTKIPDPIQDAIREAERISKNRHYFLVAPVERVIADSPWIKKNDILTEVENFYKEAISKVPSYTKYPESKKWVDYIINRDRYLIQQIGLSTRDIAVLRSLGDFLTFRGYKKFGLRNIVSEEKCRVAFLPETDKGPMHIKNVDDPIEYWKPEPPLIPVQHISKSPLYGKPFVIDGVGSGLHIDDEVDEIFPLPVREMVYMYADDTLSAIEFLKRYSHFWGGMNVLIYDRKYNSVAIEKCSRSYFELFHLEEGNFIHISGMVCRNPDSPQAKYQREKRQLYRNLFNLPDDGPDALFWDFCEKLDKILRDGLKAIGKRLRAQEIINLFITAYPYGLRKDGLKIHPQQGLTDYTLITHCFFPEEKLYYRWQRKSAEEKGAWQEKPEVSQFTV